MIARGRGLGSSVENPARLGNRMPNEERLIKSGTTSREIRIFFDRFLSIRPLARDLSNTESFAMPIIRNTNQNMQLPCPQIGSH